MKSRIAKCDCEISHISAGDKALRGPPCAQPCGRIRRKIHMSTRGLQVRLGRMTRKFCGDSIGHLPASRQEQPPSPSPGRDPNYPICFKSLALILSGRENSRSGCTIRFALACRLAGGICGDHGRQAILSLHRLATFRFIATRRHGRRVLAMGSRSNHKGAMLRFPRPARQVL